MPGSPRTRQVSAFHNAPVPSLIQLQYIVGSFACIGGGLFGLDISSMASVLTVCVLTRATFRCVHTHSQNPAWIKTFNNPNSSAQGAITASMPAGSLVGALITTWLGDRLGRKKTVILAGWIWVIGSILMCASVVRISTDVHLSA
jgi:MFS family permease